MTVAGLRVISKPAVFQLPNGCYQVVSSSYGAEVAAILQRYPTFGVHARATPYPIL